MSNLPYCLVTLVTEIVEQQKIRLLACANEINPRLTAEDILQPNDFPELENQPFFRYEEGVLEGLQSALAAIQAQIRESERITSCSTR